ncbi:hypothetical protein, conserved [Angomonas deanei]|uniref:Uncharacterized protein n=1 Tax=Angomonas deanei TaxID=59799 RepID=A0A7G2C587_9TRYP|nr:hypothetical protein, conserved [Angomonas deanei]
MFPLQKEIDSRQRPRSFVVGKKGYSIAPLCGLYRMEYELGNDTEKDPTDPFSVLRQEVNQGIRLNDGSLDHYALLSVSTMTPLVCLESTLSLQATRKTKGYTVQLSYTAEEVVDDQQKPAEETEQPAVERVKPWYCFFFPFSECGAGVETFSVKINKTPLFGEIVRSRRRDGRLISSQQKKAFLGDSSDLEDEEPVKKEEGKTKKEQKLLYFYIIGQVDLPSLVQGDKKMSVEVFWRTRQLEYQNVTKIFIPYSFYCSPCYPDSVRGRVQLDPESPPIRDITSPNCKGSLLYVRTVSKGERSALFRLEAVQSAHTSIATNFNEKDGMLLFEVQLGKAWKGASADEISYWGLFTVIAVLLLILWYFLTKDLQL